MIGGLFITFFYGIYLVYDAQQIVKWNNNNLEAEDYILGVYSLHLDLFKIAAQTISSLNDL